MKIVYCIAGTHNSGGMERVLANKANYLSRIGNDITIITTDQRNKTPYFEMDSRIKHYDLNINYCENENKSLVEKLASYPFKQHSHFVRLSAFLKTHKADIVISMFDHEASFLYKIKDGSKKVLEIHFSRFKRIQYGRRGVWKLIDSLRSRRDVLLARKYDSFVVLTHEDKKYWNDLDNMVVIPNANSFEPQSQSSLINKRVIAVGRYDYQKGFDNLIKIWKVVNQYYPDWSLDIFGDGPLKKSYKRLINDLELNASVSLCPPVKDIEREYIKRSILVMTSRYEGFGMALTEAQSCGLPLIAFACKCGPRDIIKDGVNGFLVEEYDNDIMSEKLMKLMGDENLRIEMGSNAKLMSDNFSLEKIMAIWLELFDTLKSK
ncbi:glycosyltransferase family 4 protein [Sphingobacterium hungaricum]|uniref:Glycosyltransferase family 4 protein n=1 Tax=Sphingobacterium hungaricum TaxID=2082723 RepID=A0A928UUZ7_9SPHI|nr:glycosyltransferase family 4 protein [Sphingobacterium hungaricum]MBE8712353.1 glycosyltransferase family 4 protein [Sphingobacterium hungaricum]